MAARFAKQYRDIEFRIARGGLPSAQVGMALREIVAGHFIVGGLLKLIGVMMLGAVGRFVVADNFREGNHLGGVRIDVIGDKFRQKLGNLVERNVPERTVYVWEMVRDSPDMPIVRILRPASKKTPEAYLAHIFQMMEMGGAGYCTFDDRANFGYMAIGAELLVPFWTVTGGGIRVDVSTSRTVHRKVGSRVLV